MIYHWKLWLNGQEYQKKLSEDNLKHPAKSKLYDVIDDWNIIVAGIEATFPNADIENMTAREFNTIYLPNIKSDTTFGNIMRIMTADIKNLSDEEKNIRRTRLRSLNKNKELKSANELNSFFRNAFSKKGGKK